MNYKNILKYLIGFKLIMFLFFQNFLFAQPNWLSWTTSNSMLPSNEIYALSSDIYGNTWVGTFGGGLISVRIDSSWTIYNTSNSGIPSNYIQALLCDHLNNIWIGTTDGLAKFDGASWTIYNTANSGLPKNDIISLHEYPQGTIWIGSWAGYSGPDGGLAKFDGASWTIYNSTNSNFPDNSVTDIKHDDSGNLWIAFGNRYTMGSPHGAGKYDGNNWSFISVANQGGAWDFVSALEVDLNQNIWFGTPAGLAKYNGQNWTTYTSSNSNLPINKVMFLHSKQNILWIGLDGLYNNGGVVKLEGNTMVNYNKSNSLLPSNRVWAIEIDVNDNKWFGTIPTGGTSGGGLAVYNENGLPVKINDQENSIIKSFHLEQNYPNPFNSSTIISFYIEHPGNVNLDILNIQGKIIYHYDMWYKIKGNYRISWNGTDASGRFVSSGIYFYKLNLGSETKTKKMILIK